MYRKQKTCLGSCFLRLMFLLRSLFLVLIELSLFKILLNVYRALSRVHSGMFLSYSKKRKNSQNEHLLSLIVIRCHSLSFEVIRCLSLYHSLSFVVPLAVSLVCLFINNLIFFKNCWLKMS